MKKHIRSIKKIDLIKDFEKNNIKKFHALQVFEWVHKKHLLDVDRMTNISKNLRDILFAEYNFYEPKIEKVFDSKIDDTKKFLIRMQDDNIIECVLMTYSYGKTLCISTQVGCEMGCKFCASTIGGLKRNLDVYELLSQVYNVEKYLGYNIDNIVIMGIGEPLNNLDNLLDFLDILNDENGDNLSRRNITVSTCGIVPNIIRLSNFDNKFTLALSLHAPNDIIRNSIMPISKKYSIDETLEAMALYYIKTKRRITIEYALMDGINSNKENAKELSNLLESHFIKKHIDFNVNLIPVNEVKESGIKRPSMEKVNIFKGELEKKNINVTLRRELGKDISGSCGQLRRSYIDSKCQN